MKKKTKVVILVLMVALLGVTGYLNIALNNNVIDTGSQNQSNQGYFVGYRQDRKNTRDQELAYYDAIITSASSSAESVATAGTKKLEIIALMEQELVIEGLIKAKGFEDCIVTNSTNNINVVVKSKELLKTEVAKIVAIIQEQTSKAIENIKIIPVE